MVQKIGLGIFLLGVAAWVLFLLQKPAPTTQPIEERLELKPLSPIYAADDSISDPVTGEDVGTVRSLQAIKPVVSDFSTAKIDLFDPTSTFERWRQGDPAALREVGIISPLDLEDEKLKALSQPLTHLFNILSNWPLARLLTMCGLMGQSSMDQCHLTPSWLWGRITSSPW